MKSNYGDLKKEGESVSKGKSNLAKREPNAFQKWLRHIAVNAGTFFKKFKRKPPKHPRKFKVAGGKFEKSLISREDGSSPENN